MQSQKRRLLVLSCAQRKRQNAEPLPAIERYDGPTFRLLRRYRRIHSDHHLDIYILSARYGLIPGHQQIPTYDVEMTPERSDLLRTCVTRTIRSIVEESKYQAILACAGRHYLNLIANGLQDVEYDFASGTVGRQLTLLHNWLYSHTKTPASVQVSDDEVVSVTLRGIEVRMTPAKAQHVLQKAVQASERRSSSFQSWYTEVDGELVSLKWAVSQLSGLSVADFHTDDAKRVLQRFGFTINLKK